MSYLASFPQLEELGVDCSGLSEKGLQHLGALKGLRDLKVSKFDSPDNEKVRFLREALPETDVDDDFDSYWSLVDPFE
jgi:hypothetical protein